MFAQNVKSNIITKVSRLEDKEDRDDDNNDNDDGGDATKKKEKKKKRSLTHQQRSQIHE